MPKRKRSQPESSNPNHPRREKPISSAYPEIDTDLARDNLEDDIPECDLPE